VVILIVESLAAESVEKRNTGIGYTPFLDSLMAESVVFESSFANGRRSIDALPAIFASIPAWRDEPFVTSAFSGNRIDALPRLLRAQGYQTYFFHGAFNGSMHFDVFSSIAGIEHYVGMSQYQAAVGDDRNYDGQWGIFDEPFLQFVLKTIDRSKRPFMAGAFTLSSHNPFRIPSEYKGKFPKGTLPIHQSIGYADHALKSFFDAAKSKNWYRDTVFVITGDHTSLTDQPSYDNALGRFRVPIFIFDPMGTLPKIGNGKIAQHVDITPTLLDLLGLSSEHQVAFGSSLFSPGYQGRFLQHEYGSWYYLDHQALVKFDERDGHARFYRPTDALFSKTLPNEEIQNGQFHSADKLQILKAARQYFFNGMLDNSW